MRSTPVRDVLLPASDGAALSQAIVVLAATIAVASLVRRERALVLLTIGVGMCALAFMGLRTLH